MQEAIGNGGAPTTPDPKKPTFDAGSLLQAQGYTLLGAGSEPGTVRVTAPPQPTEQLMTGESGGVQQKQQTLDLNAMLKQGLNVDPSQVNVRLNTPETAVNDSPMNFVDRFKYEAAQTPKDKARMLADQYGSDNIKYDQASGGFLVNDRGVWHNADATGMSGWVGKNGDVVAGATAGAEVGSALMPGAGTLALGAAGGVGAMLARFGSYEAAQAAGIRSQQDAEDVGREIGKEGLLAFGGIVAPAVAIKGGAAVVDLIGSALKNVGETAIGNGAKRVASQFLGKITDTDPIDMRSWLDNPAAVGAKQKAAIEYESLPVSQQVSNPIREDMADKVQAATLEAKKSMNSDYKQVLGQISPITKDVVVDVAKPIDTLKQTMQDMGMVTENGKFDPEATKKVTQGVVDPSSVSKLKQAWDLVNRATSQGSKLAFDDAHTLVRNMDEILEAAGMYSKGDAQMTSRAQAQIMGLRQDLNESLIGSLRQKSPQAADLMEAMNAKYSDRRGFLDDLAFKTKDEKVDATINKMLGPSGDRNRQAMFNILSGTKIDPENFMNDLFQSRAALNTTKLFGKGQGFLSMKSASVPFTANQYAKLQNLNKVGQYVSGMSQDARNTMLSSPGMLAAFGNSLDRANSIVDQLPQTLLKQSGAQQPPQGDR